MKREQKKIVDENFCPEFAANKNVCVAWLVRLVARLACIRDWDYGNKIKDYSLLIVGISFDFSTKMRPDARIQPLCVTLCAKKTNQIQRYKIFTLQTFVLNHASTIYIKM